MKRRVGMQLIFLVTIVGLMFAFIWQGGSGNDDDTKSRSVAVEKMIEGGPFDVRGPWLGEEPDDLAGDGAEDPFAESEAGDDGPVSPTAIAPFVDDPVRLIDASARDRTPNVEEGRTVKEPAVAYLVHKILSERKASAEGAGTPPAKPVMSTIASDKVWALLEAKPSLYRGSLVEVRGNLVRADRHDNPLKLRAVPSEVSIGTDRVYRSYMIDEDEVTGIFNHYLVYTVDDQIEELKHLDGVVLRGYFCRLYRGEINHNGQLRKRDVPVLVAARYEKLPEFKPADMDSIGLLPWVLGIVGFGGLVVWLIMRRSDSTYDSRLKAAREAARESGRSEDEQDEGGSAS